MAENFKNHRYFRNFAENEEGFSGIPFLTDKNIAEIVDKLQQRVKSHFRKLDCSSSQMTSPSREIVVSKKRIEELLRSVASDLRFPVGNFHNRNILQEKMDVLNSVENCTFHHIIHNVGDFLLGQTVRSEVWDPWAIFYGDANPYGLRAHSEIKVREKKPISGTFNMIF
jgi:hypothetical protein